MFFIVLALLFLLGGLAAAKWVPNLKKPIRATIAVGSFALAFFMLVSTSYVHIGADEVGAKKKIYAASQLSKGQIIATNGEMGYQADVIPPGFHFSLLLNVINDVEKFPEIVISKGFYGLIETTDGLPLPEGMVMAYQWSNKEGVLRKMLDAKYFLTEGKGYKGLQSTVLKPGKYRLNPYLYKVKIGNNEILITYSENGRKRKEKGGGVDTEVTLVPAGHVGVVTSRIKTKPDLECVLIKKVTTVAEGGVLEAPLVPNGCKGVWEKPLLPGAYFMNREAFKVTIIDTRLQTWTYAGGYTKRDISLKVEENGQITQTETSEKIPVPAGAADASVDIKVEGWNVHQNLRALVQVSPENAPVVVASVGGLKEVEDRVITPAIWSEVRDVLGGQAPLPDGNGNIVLRPVRILDIVEHREALQREVDLRMRVHGAKAGVNIMEVRFGNPDIPPELLVARKREQLAQQLERATKQERKFQLERVKTEEAKATADQQSELVKFQIRVKQSKLYEQEQENNGRADKKYLLERAEGERARVDVLGRDKVLIITLVNAILDTLKEKPELVKMIGKLVPNNATIVTGGGGFDLSGAAAILGGALSGRLEPTNRSRK